MWYMYHMSLIVHVIHLPHDIDCTCDTCTTWHAPGFTCNTFTTWHFLYMWFIYHMTLIVHVRHLLHANFALPCGFSFFLLYLSLGSCYHGHLTCDTFTTWHWLDIWYMYYMPILVSFLRPMSSLSICVCLRGWNAKYTC